MWVDVATAGLMKFMPMRRRSGDLRACFGTIRALLLPLMVAITTWPAANASPDAPGTATLGTEAGCRRYSGLPSGFGRAPLAGMRWIAAGRHRLGNARGYAEERNGAEVELPGFWIDRTEVSNAQFAVFVAATGHVTAAERQGTAVGFSAPATPGTPVAPNSWWKLAQGADWRHPTGPGSDLAGKDNHPVVNLAYEDALAYARWLGRTLPSEAQWEYAARAGLDNAAADALARERDGKPASNAWQGLFPYRDEGRDGHRGLAPVGCYPANAFGLHDMVGNAWEWTRDLWAPLPAAAPEASAARVIKGGSYLCSTDWCARARASSRQPQESDLAALHLGFRTVRNEP